MSERRSKEVVNELATELKKEVRDGGGPMLQETAVQEVITGGPIVDEIRAEQAEGGGPIIDALQGTGLENPPADEGEGLPDEAIQALENAL